MSLAMPFVCHWKKYGEIRRDDNLALCGRYSTPILFFIVKHVLRGHLWDKDKLAL